MTWIAQAYDNGVHVVPGTYSDARQHVLEAECWCAPTLEYVYGNPEPIAIIHQNERDRPERL